MKKIIFASAALLLSTGCVHQLRHGTIAMKENDTMAHVSIHDVKPGDHIELFQNKCKGTNGSAGRFGIERTCEREKLGIGTVKNVFNDHYSLVEFPNGTRFKEGDFVETTKE